MSRNGNIHIVFRYDIPWPNESGLLTSSFKSLDEALKFLDKKGFKKRWNGVFYHPKSPDSYCYIKNTFLRNEALEIMGIA